MICQLIKSILGDVNQNRAFFQKSLDNAKMYQEHLCVLWKHICIMPILMGKNGMSSNSFWLFLSRGSKFFWFSLGWKEKKKEKIKPGSQVFTFLYYC